MNAQVLVNEIIIGEEGTDRKTLVPCTVEQARVILKWFKGELDDMVLVDMLADHPILHCHPTATFKRLWPDKDRATPVIEMRIPGGEGYDIYVPTMVVGLDPGKESPQ